MTDNTELKRLAEAAIVARDMYIADECNGELADEQSAADDAFHDAAGPDEVLALIAENERLKAENDEPEWHLMMTRLEDQNAQLKAANEALRKDAERYRWLRDSDYAGKILRDMGAKYRADSDQRIDAAMGKGEPS